MQPKQSDISQNAIRLGRTLDRLPDGLYDIQIQKQQAGWMIEIHRIEPVRKITLDKVKPNC